VSGSQIERIIDYTALVAASIEGVKTVAGSGAGYYDDPLRPGQKIAACHFQAVNAYTHWSDVPNAPPVEWVSQSGTVELSWTIPMRLWLPKDDSEARRTALPFYDRYLGAFIQDNRLAGGDGGNLVLRTLINRFSIGGNDDWSWLDIGLLAVERVSYP
jgi:hypothetical protein